MNLQQLEYIVAVADERHFVRAAEKCFITQATLSMMIKKLEEELDCIIFDRSKQPVVPTEIGETLISQARVVVQESKKLVQLSKENKTLIAGEIKLGIIPTIAPYLLPLFLNSFLQKYPTLKVSIKEITTSQIIEQLQKGTIDFGILATPLNIDGVREDVLYYEKFKLFTSNQETELTNEYVLPEEIDVNRLLLLEEGHCMRTQMLTICELQKHKMAYSHLDYQAGSIESLVNLVETYKGITIIPELYIGQMPESKKIQIKNFVSPEPVREVSLVTYRYFAKERTKTALITEIKESLVGKLADSSHKQVIAI
jgi:LysR family transcriptional regulator, hydrogen peroxide-inducible genes activator